MPSKHPSSRSVAITIITFLVVTAAGAYGLGVMNMKKEEPTTETVIEETANSTNNDTHDHDHDAKPAGPIDTDLLAIKDTDIVLGKSDAPVTVVEYSSLSCPHCANFHEKEFEKIQTQFIDAGQVKFVIRAFPLNAPALKGTQLVECVKPEERVKFLKVLFAMQPKWAFSESYMESLKQIAAVGGVSEEAFDACMADKSKEEAIIKNVEEASTKLGINGTPTFFINGKKLEDSPTAENMSEAIKAAQTK